MADDRAAEQAPAGLGESTSHDLQLENHVHQLAEGHTVTRQAGEARRLLGRLETWEALLGDAYDAFAGSDQEDRSSSYAAEWLLDNFYVVQQAVRQVREDMPKGYYRQLPKLTATTLAGEPRVYAIALEILRTCDGPLSPDHLTAFIQAYQEVAPLTMGEVWALPTMLRVGALLSLTQAIADIAGLRQPDGEGPAAAILLREDVPGEDIVANAILSLRMLATQDWKAFFENVSQVETILCTDPAGIYPDMDFATRDRYRQVVEHLALAAEQSEVEVAREAIRLTQGALARNGHGSARDSHVGYYLVDAGRTQLEERIGYRAPWDARARRWLLDHPTLVYLGSVGMLTLLALFGLAAYAHGAGATLAQSIGVAVLLLVPAVTIAVSIVNWLLTHLLPPRVLPKLDFREGIPAGCRTMIIVPTLLTGADEVESLLRQVELHFLGNMDPHLSVALLTDFADAPQEHMPDDDALIERATAGIRALNQRYHRPAANPFYLLHRKRVWNPREGVWMGWERKRGKLEEFNRLVLGKDPTSFTVQIGDLDLLPEIRYVITLDADTVLPRESAHRLIGTLAHPLNRATFDPDTGQVIAGYTVLQPRTEIKPTSANQSLFTQVFAGEAGLDLYTRAVSDVYQDLFGEGIYVGKGIYDVAAFDRILAGRVPENALLSHDLFEGIHGRAGLVSDVVLFEDYPPSYLVYAHRMNRWIRGDWQLLPWLLPRMPHAGEGKIRNSLSLIDRWKILDNLRRSLLSPVLLVLLIAAWLGLPGSPLVWTFIALVTPAVPLIIGLATEFTRRVPAGEFSGPAPSVRAQIIRWALVIAFLPYEAIIHVDAIAVTLVRLLVTRRHLLQWTTAARMARLFGQQQGLALAWQQMVSAPLVALALTALIRVVDVGAFPVAAPFLFVWLISPQIAYWISRPVVRRRVPLSAEQHHQLHQLARRTWLYFEQFVNPDDHWLPPDHFQESPRGLVAHRTSPTNIGLMLLSTLAAHDLGYIGILNLALRLQDAFDSLEQLERYRGHFLNWYDTRTLEPLAPRFVSTVDSGNLAGCLLALRQGCQDLCHDPILRWQRWQGLLHTLDVMRGVVADLPDVDPETVKPVQDVLADIRRQVLDVKTDPRRWASLIVKLNEEDRPALDQRLLELIEANPHTLDTASVDNLHIWSGRIRHHLLGERRGLESLAPWLLLVNQPPQLVQAGAAPTVAEAWQALVDELPVTPPLDEVPAICETAQQRLTQFEASLDSMPGPADQLEAAREWCEGLAEALESAQENAQGLVRDYQELSAQAEAYVQSMEFGFLYDSQRQVFHIGFNVNTDQLDANYYDLLASEARIASLVAIAKGDVPQSHWLHMGRPLTRVDSMLALLSWSGTMFEYLMPTLLMREYDDALLSQSNHAAIEHQIQYGRQRGVPWGVSESGFYQFDANMNYQYRAFGIPGLGFKRGLGEDLVITPYASLLALPLRPQAVMDNIDQLLQREMLGTYGLYEAADFTDSRVPLGQEQAVIRSFMAHHQGMILLALVNYLTHGVMVSRFHADPRIQSVELLLQEQVPSAAPVEDIPEEEPAPAPVAEPKVRATPWRVPVHAPFPEAHFLSNGRYGVLITSAGTGYSRWQDTDLTRWRADTTLDNWGTWIYVQDQDSGALWSAGYQPTATAGQEREVFFAPHQADFRCDAHDVSLHLEITVPPEDDVEIRRITLTNRSDRPRRLRLTSYGEIVLAPQDVDRRHPAFNKLFIESEYLARLNALLFSRRARSAEETPIHLMHALIVEPGREVDGTYEGDRARFLGRGKTARAPAALAPDGAGLSGRTGTTLEPIMALGQAIQLEPHATTQLAFITLAADSREAAIALAERFQDWPRINRAFDQARSQSELEMRQLEFTVPELERIQQLLSLMIYPYPALRAEPETLAANNKGQPGLWPYAISGDYPILLVRVGSEEKTDLVHEALRAHTYWRKRGLKIDLVILNEEESSYDQEVQGRLHQLVLRTNSDAWLNRRGGIFLLRADQMPEPDRVLLATAARAILDGAKGSLVDHLLGIHQQPTRLPAFVPTLVGVEGAEPEPPLPRPADLVFDNGTGGFSADGREYVIYLAPDQRTPAPWVNVIANPDFGFLVSEAGGGNTWAVNSGENRLTPWRNDPVGDAPGEALYLRDEETAQVWSPTPLPAGALAPYLIRHGAGCSVFENHSHGLKQRMRVFAVRDAPVKVVQLRLENVWNRVRRITATYYAEWVLGTTRDVTQQYVVPEYDAETRALLARNAYNVEFGERVAFVAANKEPHGLTTDRAEFLGRMGHWGQPAALDRVGLAGTVQPGSDPCAAIQLHVDLQPGQAEEVYFLVGQGADREEALQLVRQYRAPEQVETAWQEVTHFWDDLLGTVTVETPEPSMDLLLNRWLLYQDLACRVWGRSALYQSSGAFGFRDQLQDALALLYAAPGVAREHILRAARHQFEAGDVLHWWHPPSGRGVRTRISDDLLWLPFVTAHYVTTTGDQAILTEEVPFITGDPLEPDEEERYGHYDPGAEAYSLYEHCRRAIAKGSTAGPHGLPLMGAGDWNDGMNRVGIEGRGESIWLGWFLYAILTTFAPVCRLMDDAEQAKAYTQQAQDLGKALETHGWDGDWYRRAYYDDGTPLGSAQNRECQIDSIPQSWAVLSGGGDPQHVAPAMQAIADRLVKQEGQLLLLFTPAFDQTPQQPGYIKGYPPGIRENGGQYTHAALWAVWAFAELGQGDRAAALFQMLNPIHHSDTPEKVRRYRVEPYVVAADVYSVAPYVGHGGWTWYTGSAGWMYRLGLEAILGLHQSGDVLRIAPCIPRDWPSYQLTYRHGESTYHIRVDNPDGVNCGVKKVTFDGEVLSDGEIPLVDDGRRHDVHVRMG